MRLMLLVCAALCLNAQSLSLKKADWGIIGDKQVKLSNNNGSLIFNFPSAVNTGNDSATASPPTMNYLFTGYQGSIAGYTAISVTLQVSTSGTPFFNYQTESFNTCVFPAHARPYFAANGVDLGVEFGRWWSNPIAYELGPGTVTLTIPLTPDAWSSVYGKFGNYDSATMAMFQEALQTVTEVGLTFGGGCFFGHGIYVTGGTAEFQLLSYSIW